MDKIKCPACEAEIPIDAENCPSCGAPVGTMKEKGISGTPIDNKEAIDSMLEKANMLVEEGRELGIEGLDEEPAPQPEGGADEHPDGGSNDGHGHNPDSLVVENDPGIVLFEMDENGNVIPEKEPEPPKTKKQKTKKERRRKKEESYSDYGEDSGGKKKKSKSPKSSKGAVFVAAAICLVIGAAAGFFGKMFLFPDMPSPSCQDFAEKAVKSVNSVFGSDEEIFVAESYVKEFVSSTQCLIRTFSSESGVVSEKWYRVKVDSSDSKKINVYTQYSDEELDDMYNSSDDEERAKAAVLAGIQEETDRYIEEMRQGNGWVEVNPALLNNAIHPYRVPDNAKNTEAE